VSHFADRVYEQSRSTGTADITLLGPVVGYQSCFAAFGAGSPFYYVIAHPTLNEWEVGLSNGVALVGGSYVLSRTTVIASSNANALVNFDPGMKDVRNCLPAFVAGKFEPLSASASLTFGAIGAGTSSEQTITVTGAIVGSEVVVTPNGAPETNLAWCGYVSAANTVTIRLANCSSVPITPAARTWRATVRLP
jgi:hypothetical protein